MRGEIDGPLTVQLRMALGLDSCDKVFPLEAEAESYRLLPVVVGKKIIQRIMAGTPPHLLRTVRRGVKHGPVAFNAFTIGSSSARLQIEGMRCLAGDFMGGTMAFGNGEVEVNSGT